MASSGVAKTVCCAAVALHDNTASKTNSRRAVNPPAEILSTTNFVTASSLHRHVTRVQNVPAPDAAAERAGTRAREAQVRVGIQVRAEPAVIPAPDAASLPGWTVHAGSIHAR